jgi:hypothetical protein
MAAARLLLARGGGVERTVVPIWNDPPCPTAVIRLAICVHVMSGSRPGRLVEGGGGSGNIRRSGRVGTRRQAGRLATRCDDRSRSRWEAPLGSLREERVLVTAFAGRRRGSRTFVMGRLGVHQNPSSMGGAAHAAGRFAAMFSASAVAGRRDCKACTSLARSPFRLGRLTLASPGRPSGRC